MSIGMVCVPRLYDFIRKGFDQRMVYHYRHGKVHKQEAWRGSLTLLDMPVYVVGCFSPDRATIVTTKGHRYYNERADNGLEKGQPLPKFGEWDVNDPASAEGFTVIFNKARDEKKTGGKAESPARVDPPIRPSMNHHKRPSKKGFCCFQSPSAES